MLGHDWRIFDVGGARSLVRPFFSLATGLSLILTLFLREVRSCPVSHQSLP